MKPHIMNKQMIKKFFEPSEEELTLCRIVGEIKNLLKEWQQDDCSIRIWLVDDEIEIEINSDPHEEFDLFKITDIVKKYYNVTGLYISDFYNDYESSQNFELTFKRGE